MATQCFFSLFKSCSFYKICKLVTLFYLHFSYSFGFALQYMKLRPSLKLCHGMQPKLAQTFATNLDGASSELSSSDS